VRIERTDAAHAACLALVGRLDAAWSESVAAALEDAIRMGRPRIELDMRETTFVSSVGIGTILRALTRFRAVGGTLVIVGASDPVRDMLRVAKLDALLGLRAEPVRPATVRESREIGDGWSGSIERTAAADVPAPLARVQRGSVAVGPHAVALGHVALAPDEPSAAGLYGDGLVAGGTAVVLPADAPRADCMASTDAGTVTVQARDALVANAEPSWHGHFEAAGAGTVAGAVTVSSIARALVRALGGPVAFVACGECAGAFGAWARSSPDLWAAAPGAMPPDELRRAIRFAGEPMHRGETMVAVAFASGDAAGPCLHAHVAVTGYRPMPQQARAVTAAGQVLAEQPLRAVMHALRAADGTESSFVRGSLWAFRTEGGPA
jgi:anti-anti-sigma factor